MKSSRTPTEIVRLFAYLALLVTAVTFDDGWFCSLVCAIVILTSLTIQVLRKAPFYRLIMMWEVGFLLIACIESLTQADTIVATVGLDEYNWASRYLVAAFAATALVHGLIFRERGFELKAWSRNIRLNRRAPLAVILATYAFYLAYYVPVAISAIQFGRVGTWAWTSLETLSPVQLLTSGFALAAGLLLAPMVTYYVLWIRRGSFRTAILFSLPIFALQFVSGTRYQLLFPSIAVTVMSLSASPISFKTLVRLAGVGLAVVLVSILMLRFRDFGLANASEDALKTTISDKELPSSEGTVVTMAMAVDYFRDHEYLHGESNLGILFFWIPRAFWPEKPTFLGYWFPRAYGLKGIGDIHNVAGTFAADGYVDFGFYGGILFCCVIGFGLGLLDRWCARTISLQGHPAIVIASPLYGATFFAIRSLDTTIVSMASVVALGLLFASLVVPHPGRARHNTVGPRLAAVA